MTTEQVISTHQWSGVKYRIILEIMGDSDKTCLNCGDGLDGEGVCRSCGWIDGDKVDNICPDCQTHHLDDSGVCQGCGHGVESQSGYWANFNGWDDPKSDPMYRSI